MTEGLDLSSTNESQVKVQSDEETKIESEIRQSWIDANVRNRECFERSVRKSVSDRFRRSNKIRPLYFGPKVSLKSSKRSKSKKVRKPTSNEDSCYNFFAKSLRLTFGGEDNDCSHIPQTVPNVKFNLDVTFSTLMH